MKLLYFAWLRTRIGKAEEEIAPPDGIDTVADLLVWLEARGSGYAAALADPTIVRVAVNHQHAGRDRRLSAGDEVALFPPVTGG
jgi:molybdopterin synthase sulfur carrier subunit